MTIVNRNPSSTAALVSVALLATLTLGGCGGAPQSTASCSNPPDTSWSAKPTCFIESNPNADIFVYKGEAYLNVAGRDTATDNPDESQVGDEIGTIAVTRTTDLESSEPDGLVATKLAEGTAIHVSNSDNMIMYAEVDGALIPYQKIVEG